jgi:hypothetical protein
MAFQRRSDLHRMRGGMTSMINAKVSAALGKRKTRKLNIGNPDQGDGVSIRDGVRVWRAPDNPKEDA